MQARKVKTIIVIATILVASLLILSGYLLYVVHTKKQEIAKQNIEITKLNNKLDYYNNQNADNKNHDIDIIIPEEN